MFRIKKLALSVSWGAFSTIFMTNSQLAFLAVMVRLLDKASFGAHIGPFFFDFFAQMGSAPTLIQKLQQSFGNIAAALSASIGISLLFFCLTLLAAPFFACFYGLAEFTLFIVALGLNFLIGCFSTVLTVLMLVFSVIIMLLCRYRRVTLVDHAPIVTKLFPKFS